MRTIGQILAFILILGGLYLVCDTIGGIIDVETRQVMSDVGTLCILYLLYKNL